MVLDILFYTNILLFVGIPYEVTIWTTDKRGAGTDANVFLQLYGVDGKTEKTQLRNRSDNFERGQKDIFKVCFIICVLLHIAMNFKSKAKMSKLIKCKM